MAKNPQMEDFEERGVMNEVDQDYLDHLDVPELSQIDQVTLEGVIKAVVHGGTYGLSTFISDPISEIKGWFLGLESKRKYTESILQDLADWLKDKDINYRDLDLDMGGFKTWLKTSETFFWRFYFLLNDDTWHRIETDLKQEKVTELENIFNISFKDRQNVTKYLDSISNIKGLMKVIDEYKKRMNRFYSLITEHRIKIKGAPFQVILLGAVDLRRTCKKIVNLAI